MVRFWKRPQTTRQTEPTVYPSGTFVDTGTDGYWYIGKGGKRYKILSERVLDSWRPARVVYATLPAIVNHKRVGRLGFREGTLLNNIKDGRIYLVTENLRRPIESPDVLTRLGGTMKDVVVVSDDEIKLHSEGEPLK